MASFSIVSGALLLLAAFLPLVSSLPSPAQPLHRRDPSVDTIKQYPNGTWVENIAVRANGQMVVTLLQPFEVRLLTPPAPGAASADVADELLHTFDGGVLGVAEYAPGLFAVNVGFYGLTVPGNYSVWRIDVRGAVPQVSLIAHLPSAKLLNGMTVLPTEPTTLLLADSSVGAVFALDPASGAVDTWLADAATMAAPPGRPVPIGINGVRYLDGFVYYNNLAARALFRQAVDPVSGRPAGYGPEALVPPSPDFVAGDDFAIARCSAGVDVYLVGENTLVKVSEGPSGAWPWQPLVGGPNSTVLAGATSAALDGSDLIVVTDGGLGAPVNGNFIEGGEVLRIKV